MAESQSAASTPTPRRNIELGEPHKQLTLLRALVKIKPPEVPPILAAYQISRGAFSSKILLNVTYDRKMTIRPPVLRNKFQASPGKLHLDDGGTVQGSNTCRRYLKEREITNKLKMRIRFQGSHVRESWSRNIVAETAATVNVRGQREKDVPGSLAADKEGNAKPYCHFIPRQQGSIAPHKCKRTRRASSEEPMATYHFQRRHVGSVEQLPLPIRDRDSPTNGNSRKTGTTRNGVLRDICGSAFCVIPPPVASPIPPPKRGVRDGRISHCAGDRKCATTPVHGWKEDSSIISGPLLISRAISSPPQTRRGSIPTHRATVGRSIEVGQCQYCCLKV